MSQSLFNLTTALHVSGVTIIHLQEHKMKFDFHPLSCFESDTFRKGVIHVFFETLCVLSCECRFS